MARSVRRWRAPLLGGLAVWLLSFPLLTSHWVPVTLAAAHGTRTPDVEAGDRLLIRSVGHEQKAALAAAELLARAAAPSASAAYQAPSPRQPAVPLAVRANTIVIARLSLSQPVGWYSDCLGRAAVPHWGAWRWSCAGANNIYVMAHNPGVFTPILRLRAGDIVQYGDPSGHVHTYRVSYTTIVSNTQLWPLAATTAASLTLQTCWTWDGSRDFIVRAVEI